MQPHNPHGRACFLIVIFNSPSELGRGMRRHSLLQLTGVMNFWLLVRYGWMPIQRVTS